MQKLKRMVYHKIDANAMHLLGMFTIKGKKTANMRRIISAGGSLFKRVCRQHQERVHLGLKEFISFPGATAE